MKFKFCRYGATDSTIHGKSVRCRVTHSRRNACRFVLGLLIMLTFGMGALTPAVAADLGSAKAQGLVGEKRDGYLGIVDANAPADVKQLVNSINGKRRAQYQAIAKKNKVTVDQVGRLTAEKVINNAAKGTFVQSANGAWQKK